MLLLDTGMAITTFGLDEQGNQYVADYGSGVISLFVQCQRMHPGRCLQHRGHGIFVTQQWGLGRTPRMTVAFPISGRGCRNVMPVVGNWEAQPPVSVLVFHKRHLVL